MGGVFDQLREKVLRMLDGLCGTPAHTHTCSVDTYILYMYDTDTYVQYNGLFSRGVYFANFEIAVIRGINRKTTPMYLAQRLPGCNLHGNENFAKYTPLENNSLNGYTV